MLHEITDDNFEAEVLQSELPCLLDFTASWCGPCEQMRPALERLSERYAGRVKFCHVDTDAQKGLRVRFAVAVLPFIVWVEDGCKVPLFDALTPEDVIAERIEFMLDGGEPPKRFKL